MTPKGGLAKHGAAFDMKEPCRECPFTPAGIRVHPGFAKDLAEQALDGVDGKVFYCHKSVYSKAKPKRDTQICAGSLIFGIRQGVWAKPVRIGEALGLIFPEALATHGDRVFGSQADMVEANSTAQDMKKMDRKKNT